MSQHVSAAQTAYRLFRSDSRAETIAALVLIAIVFGPVLLALLTGNSGDDRGYP
jgi:hypothetical protein